jgi:hypothetical protein
MLSIYDVWTPKVAEHVIDTSPSEYVPYQVLAKKKKAVVLDAKISWKSILVMIMRALSVITFVIRWRINSVDT